MKSATKSLRDEVGDDHMESFAHEMMQDNGSRVFFRQDPMLAFNLREVVHFLQLKSRNGDLKAAQDLDQINHVWDEMEQLKAAFHKTNALQSKKSIAREYKTKEDALIALLSKGA